MRDFTIYLAGPMTGLSFSEYNDWRVSLSGYLYDSAEGYSVNLEVINPVNYYNFKNLSNDTELEVMKWDLRAVKRSNLIIAKIDGTSIGTAMELITAYNLDIPILAYNSSNAEPHPWIRCCVDKEFTNITDLVEYVGNFYML